MSNFTLFVMILIVILSVMSFYQGKMFIKCPSCENSHTYLINQPIFSEHELDIIFKSMKHHHIVNDPSKNFGNTQGKKMNYKQITKHIPFIENKLLTCDTERKVSHVFGKNMHFAPKQDPYRIFLRLYEKENDHIHWHYDNNFTKGLRVTLVVPLYVSDCNTSEFMIKDRKTGKVQKIKIPLGKGVCYDGSNVLHKISNQTQGCKRLVAIIPLYESYNMGFIGKCRYHLRTILNKIFTL